VTPDWSKNIKSDEVAKHEVIFRLFSTFSRLDKLLDALIICSSRVRIRDEPTGQARHFRIAGNKTANETKFSFAICAGTFLLTTAATSTRPCCG
jgi:hypothetical protein